MDLGILDIPITDIMHPYYLTRFQSWFKWRVTYEGGDFFIDQYLKKFSKTEDDADFKIRKDITYNPAFAKVAIVEVRDSIYQRLCDITRVGGSTSWQDAIAGENGGVDLLGSSMNTFMGVEILEELLVMGKVGIYVDMPPTVGPTVADNANIRPYLYMYKVEDIRSWDEDDSHTANNFNAVLLRDTVFTKSNKLGLPSGTSVRYRYYYRDPVTRKIWVQFYNSANQAISPQGDATDGQNGPIMLNIDRIPFVVIELNNSLMADICNYQIALLNLASTDMAYCVGANFPFFTQQVDAKIEAMYQRNQGNIPVTVDPKTGGVTLNEQSTQPPSGNTVNVGPTTGIRYGKGLDRPDFVYPSSEPMKASMSKQEQLKIEIRLLISLAISNIQPKMASAESKGMDVRSLESGLSYIGLILEDGERCIADIWMQYEGSNADFCVKYPEKYSLRNDQDVYAEVDKLEKELPTVPSDTFKRAVVKRIAELLIGHRLSLAQINQMNKEIDDAEVIAPQVDKIEKDVPLGILSPADAAKIRGYPKNTVHDAQVAQAERIAIIAKSQAPAGGMGQATPGGTPPAPGARGAADLSANPAKDVADEKTAINLSECV